MKKTFYSLGWLDRASHRLEISISPDNTKNSAKIPAHIPPMCSLQFALTNCIDIRSSPRKVKNQKRYSDKVQVWNRISWDCSSIARRMKMKNDVWKNYAAKKVRKFTSNMLWKNIYRFSIFSIIFQVAHPMWPSLLVNIHLRSTA